MTYFLYFASLISNYLASWRKKPSVGILLFTAFVILLLWVGVTDGPDILNYHMHFARVEERLAFNGWHQIGFNFPVYMLKILGCSFYQYRFTATLIAMLLIYICLKKLSTNIHIVLCGYLLSEFFLEGVQFRNFLAIPFLLIGILILIRRMRMWRLWYAVTIAIAASIHNSFWVYLLFLFVPDTRSNIKKIAWVYGMIALVLTAFFFVFRNHLDIVSNFLISFDETRGLRFTHYVTRLGILVPVTLQSLAIIIVGFICKKISRVPDVNLQDLKTVQIILGINLLACFFLPLCILQITFYRLIRNLLLVNWAAIGIGGKYFRRNVIFKVLIFSYILAWMLAEFRLHIPLYKFCFL